jgi:chromosome segregation ATPase
MSFKHGSVVRLKFKNFLTYGDAVVRPGPRLNVVIGPNGSGKSSILCGLCLALGGSPSLLGRADDVREFIMNEKSSGYVEVELESTITGDANDVIRRTLRRDADGKAGTGAIAGVFELNGKPTTIKAVKELVESKYKIQVHNLLSFLPQDRVGHFSQYSPMQLLEETSKALNYKQLYEVHQKLIAKEKDLSNFTRSTETIASKLEDLKQQNERLSRDKERVEERRVCVERVKLLNKKKLWLDFDKERMKGMELKEKRDAAKLAMQNATTTIPVLNDAESDVSTDLAKLESKKKAMQSMLDKGKKAWDAYAKNAEKSHDQVEEAIDDVKMFEENLAKKEKSAEKQAKKLKDLKKKLEDMPPQETAEEELKQLRPQLKVLGDARAVASGKKSATENKYTEVNSNLSVAKRELGKMENRRQNNLDKVYKKNQQLKGAVEWVDANRKRFRRPVYGPIAADVNCASENVALYLDNHVSNAVLQAFVVETKEDQDFLYDEVRVKLGLKINIEFVSAGQTRHPPRDFGPNRFARMKEENGILGYLDEMIECPDAVMKCLMAQSKIHQVLVGSSKTGAELDKVGNTLLDDWSVRDNENGGEVNNKPQSVCIMFPKSSSEHYRYVNQISRYTQKANLQISEVKKYTSFCSTGIPQSAVARVKSNVAKFQKMYEELEEELESFEKERKEIEVKYRSVVSKGEGLRKVISDRKNAVNEVQTATKKLESLRADAAKDASTEKQRFLDQIKKSAKSIGMHMSSAATVHAKFIEDTFRAAGVECDLADLRRELSRIQDLLEEEKAKTDAVREAFEDAKAAFNECKERIRELKKTADEEAAFEDENGNETPLKAQLDELPENIDEVSLLIEEMNLKISQTTDDPHIIAAYEEKQREIKRLQEELQGEKEGSDVKLTEIKSLAAPWIAKLQNYVDICDERFGKYMHELDCTGEVELYKVKTAAGELGRFNEWGIHLKVRYRQATSLSILNAQVHSGGERSVATIMYLMALQDQLSTPFRCVDEINQGMDEIFERKVFSRVVTNSCGEADPKTGEHTGQYFLITPKLLPNMTDMENENVTVLCIFNGPFAFNKPTDWNCDNYCSRKRRLSQVGMQDDDEEEMGDVEEELVSKKKK